MTFPLICTLLFVGVTANDANAKPRLQAQIGYTPSIAPKKDYGKGEAGGLPNFTFLYLSHSLNTKLGIETQNGWQAGITGGITSYTLFDANSNFKLPDDPVTQEPWLNMYTEWKAIEYSLGADIGHSFGLTQRWDISTGLTFIWGKLSGIDTLSKYNPETKNEDVRIINIKSPVRGFQWHIGVGIPILSLGGFSLKINPAIHVGFTKEKSTNIPSDAKWKGPYSLSKSGVGIGLTLNYKGK